MNPNYQEITNKFVEGIEEAVASGKQLPWRGLCPSAPKNGASKRPYHGINVFLLWLKAQNKGYTKSTWFTFKQAQSLKGCVRKGEKGTMIFFWSFIEKKVEDKITKIPMLRTFFVFNHAQIEWGQNDPETAADLTEQTGNAQGAINALLALNPKMEVGSPAYSPLKDVVYMPSSVTDEDLYAATFAHEMIHWTGHKSRCNRPQEGGFGSEKYAFEELVAELGAAFFCSEYGIQNNAMDQNHMAYLQSWLKNLKSDPYALFRAARLATDAMNVLTGKAQAEAEEEAAEAA